MLPQTLRDSSLFHMRNSIMRGSVLSALLGEIELLHVGNLCRMVWLNIVVVVRTFAQAEDMLHEVAPLLVGHHCAHHSFAPSILPPR